MSDQACYFLWTALMGAGAGLAYDVFRILRKTFKHPDFLTQLEDLLYWVFVSVLLFYFILHKNHGEVRVYAIVGVFAGMALYFASISRLVRKAAIVVIAFFEKILLIALRILFYPFRVLFQLLNVPARFLTERVLNLARPGKKFLRNTGRAIKVRARKMKRDLFVIQKKI
jgi:spore cortex biosynthesis protein YabQ